MPLNLQDLQGLSHFAVLSMQGRAGAAMLAGLSKVLGAAALTDRGGNALQVPRPAHICS